MCLEEIIIVVSNLKYLSQRSLEISLLLHSSLGITVFILAVVSSLIFVIGLVGYQANIIQFGLDQLLEARSQYLGLFIHHATWTFQLGTLPVAPIVYLGFCSHIKGTSIKVYLTIPLILTVCLIILLSVSYWKHHWFYASNEQNNPYKTVYKIMNFVRKHKYPLRRSAFTYCDNYIPSRLDFAKERFGGPFTKEQVEDVKTFLRILLVLFALGPVFVLEVPASHFVFPLFSLHTLHYHKHLDFCRSENIWETILSTGTIIYCGSLSYLHLG